jgi:hypothetical protein
MRLFLHTKMTKNAAKTSQQGQTMTSTLDYTIKLYLIYADWFDVLLFFT